ncbi:Kelch repeat-containing protein [Thalassoroseus pseudoceratinae]|uniref:Kelch repeat-containing protein n=1 Tax=Thalassoroseus pseudoceratinae TaxID=2713176 RepID=UPI001420FDEA|nr:kelch repeat-containing protein [Thalassoroseus pseudoceratinae]
MKQRLIRSGFLGLASALLVASAASIAQAHFIFLVPQSSAGDTKRVEVYFGEDASPADPSFLSYTEGMKTWFVGPKGEPTVLKINRTDESVSVDLTKKQANRGVVIATHDLGVMDRGDAKFRLKYYAKTGPVLGSKAWSKADCSKALKLDVVPKATKDGVVLQVKFNGKPVVGSEVVASGPELADFNGTTDKSGKVSIGLGKPGMYSIRAKHVEDEAGELDGKPYPETRHYTTVALRVKPARKKAVADLKLDPLKQSVTSFGGAILDGNVYIYGGHTGSAHSYSNEEQGRQLLRLNLKTGRWNELADGPGLQGLALVTNGEKLYRIGGFTAKNAEGEEHDLWSQDSVAAFDLESNAWNEMPSLPEPRSSFDACVLNNTIYVIGGWQLAGDDESKWHKTAWSMDLDAKKPEWKALPTPPFQRRALAVAAHDGKVYAIGGMQETGGPTTRVDVFDPKSGEWAEGPSLVMTEKPAEEEGEDNRRGRFSGGMTGFGASAFATGGRLYTSTINGDLQRLSKDGKKWEIIAQTPTARFFHRMLPLDKSRLIVVGGASMAFGKFDEVEVLNVDGE